MAYNGKGCRFESFTARYPCLIRKRLEVGIASM